MPSLTALSADEISQLLDEYGIHHGPVVDSTRSLYEKKLHEAMSKTRRVKPAKASPDKTFYREEEEEVTYVYRTPVRDEAAGDSGAYVRSRPHWPEKDAQQQSSYSSYSKAMPEYTTNNFATQTYTYERPSTYKNINLKSSAKPAEECQTAPGSSRLIPIWVQIVFFLVVAIFFYVVFASMETNKTFEGLE